METSQVGNWEKIKEQTWWDFLDFFQCTVLECPSTWCQVGLEAGDSAGEFGWTAWNMTWHRSRVETRNVSRDISGNLRHTAF